jgi:hypothetical protein
LDSIKQVLNSIDLPLPSAECCGKIWGPPGCLIPELDSNSYGSTVNGWYGLVLKNCLYFFGCK